MGVLSTLYILFKPRSEVSSDYLVTYFDSNYWHKEIKLRAAEGARNHGLLNISPDDFFDIDMQLPKDIDEQQDIGSLLQKVDLVVSQRRSNLEKLQTLRLSMLEKMFGEMLRTIKETFPNAMFFGFTGTPIHDENQKNMSTTSDVFGNELHRYSIADGVRDKNVLGFDPYMMPTYKDRDLRKTVALEKAKATTEAEALADPKKKKVYLYYMDHTQVPMAGVLQADGSHSKGIEDYIPTFKFLV